VGLPAVGDTLLGKYKLLRVIGEGGMGIVFEAHHERIDRRVAIKMLRPEMSDNTEVIARFSRKARAAAKLGNHHTAHIIDVEDVDSLPIMVMEFLEGSDLADELAKRGPLPVAEAVGYLLSACVAMAEAHGHGIVHRDLKPSNLFIAVESGERVIKVLDFGISKMIEAGKVNVTSTAGTMGTPLYMSPEQVRSAKNVDARTDIWSLGIILYELLAGRPPFLGDAGPAVIAAIAADDPQPLRELRPDVPEKLAAIVHKAIAKSPKDRFESVRAFAAELGQFGPPSSSGRYAIPSDPSISQVGRARQSNPELEMADTILPSQANTAPTAQESGNPIQTAGTWSTRADETRARATKTRLIALIGGGVVLSGVVVFALTQSGPKHEAPVAASASAASVPATPAPVVSSSASAVAPVASVVESASATAAAPTPKASVARPATRPTTSATATPTASAAPVRTSTPQVNPNRL